MTVTTPRPSNNTIALVCILVGAVLTVYIFMASRNDPGLRMAALVFASNICTAIVAISSLLLTGKDTTQKGADLPPGGTQTDLSATTTTIPPAPTPTPTV
jgi:hypothetical protein